MSYEFELNKSDKCVYSKFDNKGNNVIICLYVDNMLNFGTRLFQVKKGKDCLSLVFKIKDMREVRHKDYKI